MITRHFHGMVQHYYDQWARWSDCLPLTLYWTVWSDHKVTKVEKPKCIKQGLWKSIQSRKDYYNRSLGLTGLYKNLWELHRCFQQLAWNSNYWGILLNWVIETFNLELTVDHRQYDRILLVPVQHTDKVNPFLDKYRSTAFFSQNSPSHNTNTVSPNWTTSHS